MPTYEFLCEQPECKYEWEEVLSIKAPDPEACPKCEAKGSNLRLISGGNGKGIVEYSGNEYLEKIKSDANKLKKEVYSNEYHYANVLSEPNYQKIQSRMDKRRK